MKIQDILTKEKAQDWKKFVADYVSIATRNKQGRELVKGYQVKKIGNNYTILINGSNPGYGVMTPCALYGWLERLPLVYYARQADDYRYELLK